MFVVGSLSNNWKKIPKTRLTSWCPYASFLGKVKRAKSLIYLIHTHAGSSDVDVMVAAHDVGIGTLLDQRHFLVGKMSDKLFSVKF